MKVHGANRVFEGALLTLETPLPLPLSPPELRRIERLFDELTEAKPEGGGRLRVLHEDEDLALVFKPPGVHSMAWAGTRKKWGDLTLCDALPLLLTAPRSGPSRIPLPAPLPAHRLDARVGGVIAVAKTRSALAGLSQLFRERRVEKTYRAVVVGKVCLGHLAASGGATSGPDKWAYSLSLPGVLRIEHQAVDGRLSVTHASVVEETPCSVHGTLTTLDLRPLTGRRHQLRIACALGLGAPIVGDDLYHAQSDAVRAARTSRGGRHSPLPPVRRRAGLFLQALGISLPHPITGKTLSVQAAEMGRFDKLRARAASGAAFSEVEWQAWRA